ncbi:hypothetical protein SLS64_008728 [Diaporthe eres]|uniref:Uncharacterized protein n=1 Tax=Diaporthe eres TaxID=83184 RepID=A0ABR1NXN3_DIAER
MQRAHAQLAEMLAAQHYQHLPTFMEGTEDELAHDVKFLRDTLGHFILDDKDGQPQEKLRAAIAEFQEALEGAGVSPIAALKKVISTTALATEMDTLHATMGGLDFYIYTRFTPTDPSEALRAEVRAACRRRRVEEIKKLMAKNKKEETGGSPESKTEQVADGIGQGQEGEGEKSEAREEMEMGGNMKVETELPVRGVADSQDVKSQHSG